MKQIYLANLLSKSIQAIVCCRQICM